MGATGCRTAAALLTSSLVAVLVGCGSGAPDVSDPNSSRPDATPGDPSTPISLDGVSGELVITRQRDLLDRGLINVLTRNDSGASLLLSNIELVADTFESEPAAARTISLRSGRQVAIQVPYGVADDCDTARSAAAVLTFTYASDDDPVERRARVELNGTEILDSIQAEQCTTRRFEASARTRFVGTAIVDGVVVTDLVVEPTGDVTDLAVSALSGTILVSVSAPTGWGGVQLQDELAAIPLTFEVNRCDPHALAEVTKRYGLDLDVSLDGAAPVSVAIDIDELVPDLEAIVEQCREASPPD